MSLFAVAREPVAPPAPVPSFSTLTAWLAGDASLAESAAREILACPAKALPLDLLEQALLAANARPRPTPSPAQLELARSWAAAPLWSGTLAAALLAPAWSLPTKAIAALPDTLWGAYTTWLLSAPPPEDVGTAAYGRHLQTHLSALATLLETNLAATAIRAAADAYLGSPAPTPAAWSPEHRHAIQSARARIITRIHGVTTGAGAAPTSREHRALRVGVVLKTLRAEPTTFAVLARCTHLDPAAFETTYFLTAPDYGPIETACIDRGATITSLPERLADQINLLRDTRLDVLCFAEDLAAHEFPYAHLALYRLAPLQIALGSSTTTGLPLIDLWLAGENDRAATESRLFTERLALLPGTAHAFDTAILPEDTSFAETTTRETLGLPVGKQVLAVIENGEPSAADIAAVAAALAAHPSLHVIVLDDRAEPYASASAWMTRLENTDGAYGRVQTVVPLSADLGERRAILATADVVFAPPAHLAVVALEASVPVVGPTHTPVAGILRTAGLAPWIASDERPIAPILAALLQDTTNARAALATALEAGPRFLSPFLLAQDFGALLDTAWAELLGDGLKQLRRQRSPLVIAPSRLTSPQDLPALGHRLVDQGQCERAVPCLLAAMQTAPADPALWFDLARAYRGAGATENALSALEASLRLDDQNAPGWIMLAELAADVGSLDLAREAVDLATALSPDLPELPTLRTRLAA